MTPHTLLASASTVVVGGGIAMGLGFALKPSSNAANQGVISPHNAIAPPNKLHSNNYLVLFKQQKPSDTLQTVTCKLSTTCNLLKQNTTEPFTEDELINLTSDKIYLLNIEDPSLKQNFLVEVEDHNSNKLSFVVRSLPTKPKNKIKKPDKLIPKSTVLEKLKTINAINNDQQAIQSLNYYNQQEESFIERKDIKHEGFLILQWGVETDRVYLLKDTTNKVDVDQFIFRSCADQQKHESDSGKLKAIINITPTESCMEIYQINNQETIQKSIATITSQKPVATSNPDWEALRQENIMVTKLSELVKGQYYKFVLSDFSQYANKLGAGLFKFELKIEHSATYSPRLFLKSNIKVDHYCVAFSSLPGKAGKCAKFNKG